MAYLIYSILMTMNFLWRITLEFSCAGFKKEKLWVVVSGVFMCECLISWLPLAISSSESHDWYMESGVILKLGEFRLSKKYCISRMHI